ncbi:MAG TPA: hypothetical protein VHL81_13735 [Gemmatimonadales bacterium]|jgi:hypothetical protein|nr:hypothetical protein [Gemmatimonadales bacterium]
MVWRVVERDDRRWNVSIAAERRANSPHWSLICWFRPCGDGQRSFWAPYPLSSVSRAALFAQADQIPDAALAAFLAQHLE